MSNRFKVRVKPGREVAPGFQYWYRGADLAREELRRLRWAEFPRAQGFPRERELG